MNISNPVGQTTNFGKLSTNNVTNKPNSPTKDLVQSNDPVVASRTEKEQSSNSQTVPSIVIDEQAIALFEQSRAPKQDQFSQDSSSSASQDQPSARNESAVANYQAVGNLAERESVQKMFGVDLFA
jgi:hypothetical protein